MPIVGPLAQSPCRFDPDVNHLPAMAWQLEVEQHETEQATHWHRKGQLVMALRGGVMCEVPRAVWMVPPHHAVWIPGSVPHSNSATDNARICFLFIEPGAASMPDKCCTLAISPMVRELILHLAAREPVYPREGAAARVAAVLLEQLALASVEQLYLQSLSIQKSVVSSTL